MEVMIGKYKARMKETGLVLIHPVGVSFEFTPDDAVELMEFINGCQEVMVASQCQQAADKRDKCYRLRLKSPKFSKDTGYIRICVYRSMQDFQRRWRLLYYRG